MSRATGRPSCVLDASAVLALVHGEAGSQVVEQWLTGAAISAVNLSEVAGKLLELGMPEGEAAEVVRALGLEVVPFHGELAWRAAALGPPTKALGLSLGDRACLATGVLLDRPVVTADRVWTQVDLPVRVVSVR